MTDHTLAAASDIVVWASIAVLVLAVIAFSAHLGVTGAATRRRVEARAADRELVGAGGPASREDGAVEGGAAPTGTGAEPDGAGAALAPPTDTVTGATRRWGVIGLQLTWLATFGVITGTVLRGLSVQRWPLGNMYEFALVTASFALLIYSAWSLRRDRLWLGAFVTLPVVIVLAAGKTWYTEASQLMPALDNTMWLTIHVTMATLATALSVIGAALAAAFLLRDSAERRDRVRGWLAALPEGRRLEAMTYGMHIFAFPMWTFTLVTGAIWAEVAWGRYWGWDPKEVWTFVIWAVYAAYLHARATSSWTTRRATWLALAGMACVVANYTLVNLLMTGLHSYSGVSN